MTMMFLGPGDSERGSLHLNNGLAARLLEAMGAEWTGTEGTVEVASAKAALESGAGSLSEEDHPYAEDMLRLLREYEQAGEETISWF